MKKLLLGLILSCLLISTNTMAWSIDGATVDQINISTDGTVSVKITNVDGSSTRRLAMGDLESKKIAIAALMTASSSGAKINCTIGSGLITGVSLLKP